MPEPEPTSQIRTERLARREAAFARRVRNRRRTVVFAGVAVLAVALVGTLAWALTRTEAAVTADEPVKPATGVPPAPAAQSAAGPTPVQVAAPINTNVRTRAAQPGEPVPPVSASGAVHVPDETSPERAALIEAAQLHLGSRTRLKLRQLYSDGAWAVGEAERWNGKRVFIAWRCEVPDGWIAYWSTARDDVSEDALLKADRRISCTVTERVIWPK